MVDRCGARGERQAYRSSRPFEDWTGRISLSQNITRGPELEAEAGLDRARWLVVAINVELGCDDDTGDRISVDAVDLGAFAVDSASGGYHDLVALVGAHGRLPVIRIELPAATARDMLRHMTNASINVQLAGLPAELDIVAHRRYDTDTGVARERTA